MRDAYSTNDTKGRRMFERRFLMKSLFEHASRRRVPINLQRFAGEKTEKATPKKREEARKEGNVARSSELTSAVVLAAILVVLRFSGTLIWNSWMSLMHTDFTMPVPSEWTSNTVTELFLMQGMAAVKLLFPVVGMALVTGVAVAVIQVRPMFVLKLLAPKFSRIQPLAGFQRLFSTHSLVEMVKSIVKLCVIGAISYFGLVQMISQIRGFTQESVNQLPGLVGSMVFNLGMKIAALMVALAFFDFLFQRFEYEKKLRMTKQEVKDEMKQMEGNPEIKGAIRRRARQIAFRRMMEEVPKADVIVTNPTHFAVALKYDAQMMAAPTVIAKGADMLALRLKERAAAAGVPLVENRPLAQTLYKSVEVGGAVPAELYKAVAEVLAYVYRLRQMSRR